MARNYSLPTIKTLFAEANGCAYPDCDGPLIFRDRGRATVVAEIAHIRSEKADGPRFDSDYFGDIDGPENLLLLCGKHHKPVDRHESAYTVAELETWKATQRSVAGTGTRISDIDARAYTRLTDDERQTLKDIARIAEDVSGSARGAQSEMDAIRAANMEVQRSSALKFGPVYEVDDAGNSSLIPWERIQLSGIEQREWDEKVRAAHQSGRKETQAGLAALEEELAVLRMFGGALSEAARRVSGVATRLAEALGDADAVQQQTDELARAVSWLWQLAIGATDLGEAFARA